MHSFLEPQSVVLIGASRHTGLGAYNNLEVMLRYGYRGEIYVVHPKATEILGRKTYQTVADLPDIPELAIISVGRDRVLPVFSECVQKGIKRAIVISQGFSDADERGKKLQGELVRLARESGARIIGPNTMGVLNPFIDFTTAFVDIPNDPSPPPLTIVVQSGVFQVGFESFTGRLGKAIDIGNASDVDFVDILEYLENDSQTRVIALHMEGISRGHDFLRVAARIARTKPIIAFKTGRSSAGAKAALSHTGSLVGEDGVVDIAFAKAGIVRARSMVELLAASHAFLNFRPMKGPRLGVVTATGACGIMTADACEDYGLQLAAFPEAIRSGLENSHIAWHRLHNPVDIWPLGMVSGSFTEVFKRAACGLFKDDNVDAVLGIAPVMASPLHGDLDMAAAVRDIQAENDREKPFALWLYGSGLEQQAPAVNAVPGAAYFRSIDDAVMGLAATWRYTKLVSENHTEKTPDHTPIHEGPRPVDLPSRKLLIGEDAAGLLQHYNIPLAPGGMAQNGDAACSIASDIGYPAVLKIISPQWLHKSDLGGVWINIYSEAGLVAAYQELKKLFEKHTPDGELKGMLVQKQITGIELLLGVKRDPQFGPVLVAGAGGIHTEIYKDISRSLVPVNREEADAMLRSLRIYPILQGARGRKGAYLPGIIDTMLSLSRMAVDYPEIDELDLNPVVANPQGCWCVDFRIVKA